MDLYQAAIPTLKTKPLKHLHLGGGTPTFLSVANLRALTKGILDRVKVAEEGFEGSIEVDPRRTTLEQMQALRELGFNRISLGVQDFDPEVQRLVNRIQPYAMTRDLTVAARKMGYESVNFDLIYGLPKQSQESFADSIDQTIELRPDRIALYSLAVVPWIKPQQRLFKDEDLPQGEEKRALYEMASLKLKKAGYVDIGMDHFALPTDALTHALLEKRLHRNFMGYTDQRTDVLLGLGVSSISETPDCFHQSEKILPLFEKKIQDGEIPTLRGHRLTEDDRKHRQLILDFMTQGSVQLADEKQIADVKSFLADMVADNLVTIADGILAISQEGRPFLRNACVALDQRLRQNKPDTRIFSQAL